MKLKAFCIAAITAMAFTAFGASSASATTLEVGGVTKNSAVTIEAEATGGLVFARTDGSIASSCAGSTLKTTTGTFTGHTVTATTSNLTYKLCTPVITIHKADIVHLTYVAATTAIVTYSQGDWTISTNFGFTVNCKTGAGTNVGTLHGASSGNATITINAVLNCGFLLPSATMKGTYKIVSPSGLGVSA